MGVKTQPGADVPGTGQKGPDPEFQRSLRQTEKNRDIYERKRERRI
jgi:hypothetical protein